MTFNNSEVMVLAHDLGHGDQHLVRRARQALEVGARDVKDFAQRTASQLNPAKSHSRGYPRTITYDFALSLSPLQIDIGPESGDGQGSLAGILEDGGIANRPQRNLERAGKIVEKSFERGALKAAEDALADILK